MSLVSLVAMDMFLWIGLKHFGGLKVQLGHSEGKCVNTKLMIFTFLPEHPVPDSPLFETERAKENFFAHTVSLVLISYKVH